MPISGSFTASPEVMAKRVNHAVLVHEDEKGEDMSYGRRNRPVFPWVGLDRLTQTTGADESEARESHQHTDVPKVLC